MFSRCGQGNNICHRSFRQLSTDAGARRRTNSSIAMSAARRTTVRPIHLVLDFDGTLTVADTTPILGQISEQSRSCWDHVLNGWLSDYDVFKRTPFDWKDHGRAEYARWLDSRKWLEAGSAQRAQDCGMFCGVRIEDVNQAVRRAMEDGTLKLQDGWSALMSSVIGSLEAGSKVSVISVNWSEAFIRRSLYDAAQNVEPSAACSTLSSYINNMDIFANEIHGLASPEGSSGRTVRPFGTDLRTSGDKLRYFDEITRTSQGVKGAPDQGKVMSVYVGDSATDFACLCQAGIGIWLCDVAEQSVSEKFQEVFKPLEADAPIPLATLKGLDRDALNARLDADKSLFYWASNLATIVDVLTELETNA